MPVPSSDQHSLAAPAEQYLRALWDAKWLYLAIVAAFVLTSVIITQLLPKTYSSQAMLSVRQAPSIGALGLLYDSVTALGDGSPIGGRQELVPSRFAKRLLVNRTVTLAAQDAGIITSATRLDERDIARWVEADQFERTDLLQLTVNQPTAEGAKLFAERLLARTLDSSRLENSSAETREMLTAQVARAEAVLTKAVAAAAELETGNAAGLKARRDRAALDLELARKAYEPLRRRLDVIDLLVAEQRFQLYIVDPPTLPLRPSFPRPVLNVSIGLILGILAATFIVIVRSIFTARGSQSR
jgi:LPS O-antigen subunit length determinant protein (WzzB/FepE family)